MKKFFTMAAIALFTLTSCSEDDAAPITPGTNPTDTVLLKKTISTTETLGTTTDLYNYDSQNRLTTITDENGIVHTKFTYDGTKIIKIELLDFDGNVFMLETFEYNSTGMLSVYKHTTNNEFLPEGFPSTTRKSFTYNQDGTITTESFSGDESEQTTPMGTSVLTITNNNIVKEIKTSSLGSGTRNFIYDDKNSPYRSIAGFEVIALAHGFGGINNMIFDDREGSDMYDTTFTYTYNADNYPLTSASTSPQGAEATTIQYFYE